MDYLGSGAGQSTAFSRRRSAIFSTRTGVQYPSPFFDMGHTYLPTDVKDLLKWCRYYFLTHPLINAVVFKMSEYAVTPIVFKTDDDTLRQMYMKLSEDILGLRPFSIEIGLDYHCFGNGFVSIHFPFRKYLICKSCGRAHPILESRGNYEFRNLKYYIKCCTGCGTQGEAGVKDHYIRSVREIRLVRWNPENVDIDYNEATGESTYYYQLPLSLKNDIMLGKAHVIETVPDIYLEAMRKNKALVFGPDSVFHLKRPTIAQRGMGWGLSMILPVLKDAYYMQILRKGQEMIAQEHIVPLRVLFPQPGSATSDPYTSVNLQEWSSRIEEEINKWKLDNNYIPIFPLPIGHQIIGGNGRAMILHQELRIQAEHIVAGMGVPQEFIFGGLSYSGSNVSMRMLENHFIGYRQNLLHLLRDFVLGRVARYLGWPKVEIEFQRFKMADDLQRLFFYHQLNQAGKVSDDTLLREADVDPKVERGLLDSEVIQSLEVQRKTQLGSAAVQGEASLVQMRYQNRAQAEGVKAQMRAQMEAQQDMGQPVAPALPAGQDQTQYAPPGGALPGEAPGPEGTVQSPLSVSQRGGGIDLQTFARRAASVIQQMVRDDQNEAMRMLESIKLRNPQLHSLIVQVLQGQVGGKENPLDARQQPMPEQKPPRRSPTM